MVKKDLIRQYAIKVVSMMLGSCYLLHLSLSYILFCFFAFFRWNNSGAGSDNYHAHPDTSMKPGRNVH